jgi:hypothetical protein
LAGQYTLTGKTSSLIRIYFIASIALLFFAYGVAVGIYKVFPYTQIRNALAAAADWRDNAEHYARISPEKHLRAPRRSGDGVTRYDVEQAQQGVTLLTGMWGESLGVKLVSMDGERLHEWMVSFNEIWPQAKHLPLQPHDWDTNIHGLFAYPDGDIVFNFEHNGLVRLNQCGQVQWQLDELAHHVVHAAPDGNFWVGGEKKYTSRVPRWPFLNPPFSEDLMLLVSPEGEVLRRLSVLDIIYKSGWESLLIGANQGGGAVWKGTVKSRGPDITHLNDIEVLGADIAAAFPQFSAGDIMISLRNLHLIAVIDPATEQIKWLQSGPWMMQHDPDFLADGRIMIYDNRARGWGAAQGEGSRIVMLDPQTGELDVVLRSTEDERFFTSQMGKAQYLANGNILLSEPDAGRAIEVNGKGEVVWEYVNRWSDEKVAVIVDAIRLPADYFDLSPEACM